MICVSYLSGGGGGGGGGSSECSLTHSTSGIGVSFFLGAGGVWVTLRNTTYQNNSNVILEDIGEGDDAFFCKTNQTACCRAPYTGDMGSVGNWFFPNGTRVPSSDEEWDFHRTRGQMVIRMHRKRGGVEGIYHCEIPDAINVTQTIYIGVYSASTGKWYMYTPISALGLVYKSESSRVKCSWVSGLSHDALHIEKVHRSAW